MKRGQFLQSIMTFGAERFPTAKMNYQSLIVKKEVPLHAMSWAYFLGGLALFFFIIQVLTGLLLIFYYQPTVSDAHASVEYITRYVPAGAVIRNMHAWSASLMIFFVLAHLITSFSMKAFAKPREVTWLAGVLLLLLTFVFGFTGYLLPWNQIAVNATKVVLQSIEQVGNYLPASLAHLPTLLRHTIQGEGSVGQATLSRFYAIHIFVLPMLLVLILGIHLLSVQLHGMSQGVEKEAKKKERFFPFFIVKDFSVWALAFLVLLIVALCLPFDSLLPYPLLKPYNALGSTPAGIKPEWYFFWIYYPLEMLPFWVILVGSSLLVGCLFLIPWLFKCTRRSVIQFFAVLGAVYMVVMTVFGENIVHLVKGGS